MSESLSRLREGLTEVRMLLAANPTPRRGLPRFDVLRAIGRSSVVLATSHLEAYIYGLTEEMSISLVNQSMRGADLPLRLRLRHTAFLLDIAAGTGWERREEALINLFAEEAALWTNNGKNLETLHHERFLANFKTPRAKPLIRYFREWGIQDIFSAITRKPTTRAELLMRIDELGEKRNLIAHGDFSVQATPTDVRRFLIAIDTFCTRTDGVMRRRLQEISGAPPW